MQVDLSKYQTVKERKNLFYKNNEDGRIIVENITPPNDYLEYALFKATIYKNKEDQEKCLVWSTGYAMEIRDKEMKIASSGKKYESVNFTSWTENCEESSVGRALDNAGFSNQKCSKEEIEKAEKMKALFIDTTSIEEKLKSSKSLEELIKNWQTLSPEVQKKLEKVKNELKQKYENS